METLEDFRRDLSELCGLHRLAECECKSIEGTVYVSAPSFDNRISVPFVEGLAKLGDDHGVKLGLQPECATRILTSTGRIPQSAQNRNPQHCNILESHGFQRVQHNGHYVRKYRVICSGSLGFFQTDPSSLPSISNTFLKLGKLPKQLGVDESFIRASFELEQICIDCRNAFARSCENLVDYAQSNKGTQDFADKYTKPSYRHYKAIKGQSLTLYSETLRNYIALVSASSMLIDAMIDLLVHASELDQLRDSNHPVVKTYRASTDDLKPNKPNSGRDSKRDAMRNAIRTLYQSEALQDLVNERNRLLHGGAVRLYIELNFRRVLVSQELHSEDVPNPERSNVDVGVWMRVLLDEFLPWLVGQMCEMIAIQSASAAESTGAS